MDNESNVLAWVVGVVVVVLVILGIWWVVGNGTTAGTSSMATSTPTAATSTQPTTGAGAAVSSETRTGTVATVAASVGSSSFASVLSSTGVGASLTGKGPYTVFVPTSEAYAASAAAINAMTSAQLKRFVQYHVVSGKQLDVDAVSSGNYTALSKDALNFNVRAQDKSAFVNSAYVIKQYKASNGIVYLIGGSDLLPPQVASSTTGANGSPVPR